MEREEPQGQGRHIVIFVNPDWNHKSSRYAWEWARKYLLVSMDIVTFLTVIPRRLMTNLLPAIAAIGCSPSAALEASVLQEQNQDSFDAANNTLRRYIEEARTHGFSASAECLEQTGFTVGATLAEWVNKSQVDDGIVGCRNLGTFQKALLTLAGKGSVSSYLVDHMNCPLVVAKRP